MDATPLAQVDVVDVATYCTGEVTVEPALGTVTVTVANAGTVKPKRTDETRRKYFMFLPSSCGVELNALWMRRSNDR
jgi:hypothetical protein